jgi:hypothetical protein
MSLCFFSLAASLPFFGCPSFLWLPVRRLFLNSERPPGWTCGGVEEPGGVVPKRGCYYVNTHSLRNNRPNQFFLANQSLLGTTVAFRNNPQRWQTNLKERKDWRLHPAPRAEFITQYETVTMVNVDGGQHGALPPVGIATRGLDLLHPTQTLTNPKEKKAKLTPWHPKLSAADLNAHQPYRLTPQPVSSTKEDT